jgi:hypothetical protein
VLILRARAPNLGTIEALDVKHEPRTAQQVRQGGGSRLLPCLLTGKFIFSEPFKVLCNPEKHLL